VERLSGASFGHFGFFVRGSRRSPIHSNRIAFPGLLSRKIVTVAGADGDGKGGADGDGKGGADGDGLELGSAGEGKDPEPAHVAGVEQADDARSGPKVVAELQSGRGLERSQLFLETGGDEELRLCGQ